MTQSCAAIVGVDVSAGNKETNYTRSTRTGDSGRYSLAQMPLGRSKITAQARRFSRP
jgi:hypothetical protein